MDDDNGTRNTDGLTVSSDFGLQANETNNRGPLSSINDRDVPVRIEDDPSKPRISGMSTQSLLFETERCSLSYRDLSYQVEARAKPCRAKYMKNILENVSGIYPPGVNAIMGPTGSGKTSLLDILAARKPPKGLSGSTLVNNAPYPENFKCMAGYVIQDDIVVGMLTVRENIQFSAALRLPKEVSDKQRTFKVEEIIRELGLEKCADTKVGNAFVAGVSGGERKRTNIAMELIVAPSILFLDEPTSGLDSNTAYSVMRTLQRLGQKGKNIIFSIHQPRYGIFKMFNRLTLLASGKCVYHGPSGEAVDYFKQMGYICEEYNNPADFFLDVLYGDNEADMTPEHLVDHNEEDLDVIPLTPLQGEESRQPENERKPDIDKFAKNFKESKWGQTLYDNLTSHVADCENEQTLQVGYARSCFYQFAVLTLRSYRNIFRNPHVISTQIMSAILLALISGTIYYQVEDSYRAGIQNRQGAIFLIVMNYVFANTPVVQMFIQSREVFMHENISGYYRMSAFFFSKLFGELLPAKALPILFFSAIAYPMMGFESYFTSFLIFYGTLLLTSISASSTAVMFSATVSNFTIGALLNGLVWLIMMIFSGLLVNINSIAPWLRWLQFISIFRYSMDALLINEIKDKQYCSIPPENVTATHLNTSVTAVPECQNGNDYLANQGIAYESGWDFWSNHVALFCLMLGFLMLAFIQLRRIKIAAS